MVVREGGGQGRDRKRGGELERGSERVRREGEDRSIGAKDSVRNSQEAARREGGGKDCWMWSCRRETSRKGA